MAERVICIAAHPDDEVLGCGATLALHARAGDQVLVLFCADGIGARISPTSPESIISSIDSKSRRLKMAKKALAELGIHDFKSLDFPDNRLDEVALLEIVQAIESIVDEFSPTIIYTHHAGDLNIDHRRVCEAALTAARPLPGSSLHSIYSFEVPSSTGWGDGALNAFVPQVYMDVSSTLPLKMAALNCYSEEMRQFPHARSIQAIQALAVVRGSHVGLKAAEAFMLLRQVRVLK